MVWDSNRESKALATMECFVASGTRKNRRLTASEHVNLKYARFYSLNGQTKVLYEVNKQSKVGRSP